MELHALNGLSLPLTMIGGEVFYDILSHDVAKCVRVRAP